MNKHFYSNKFNKYCICDRIWWTKDVRAIKIIFLYGFIVLIPDKLDLCIIYLILNQINVIGFFCKLKIYLNGA